MRVINRLTGLPMEIIPANPQPSPLGDAIGVILLGLIGAAVIDSGVDLIRELLNPPKPKRRRPALLLAFEDDELSDFEWIFGGTDGKCLYCPKRLCVSNRGYFAGRGRYELDHFIPLSRGGADQPYNIVLACVDCNRHKGDLTPWEFMPERFRVGDRDTDNYI